MIRESDVTWLKVSSTERLRATLMMQRSEVDSQHKPINLDDLTAFTHDNAFTWFKGERAELPAFDLNLRFYVNIELNFDLVRSERTYYTFIDLLSDIGGVQSILTSFAGLIISIVKHDRIANFLAASLYKVRKNAKDQSP